jgi:hypothetical protein
MPSFGAFRLRLREPDPHLLPDIKLYPKFRDDRFPGRAVFRNVRAPGSTAAVASVKKRIMLLLGADEEADIFMVGGGATPSSAQRGHWTVYLAFLDPSVASTAITAIHGTRLGMSTVIATGVKKLAWCTACHQHGHTREHCKTFAVLLYKRDGVVWTQDEIDAHASVLSASHSKRGYGGDAPSSLLMLLFKTEQSMLRAMFAITTDMHDCRPHPYATAPRFSSGLCPQGYNRCLRLRTRADSHSALSCPGETLIPSMLPARIIVSDDGLANVGIDGAAEPRGDLARPPNCSPQRVTPTAMVAPSPRSTTASMRIDTSKQLGKAPPTATPLASLPAPAAPPTSTSLGPSVAFVRPLSSAQDGRMVPIVGLSPDSAPCPATPLAEAPDGRPSHAQVTPTRPPPKTPPCARARKMTPSMIASIEQDSRRAKTPTKRVATERASQSSDTDMSDNSPSLSSRAGNRRSGGRGKRQARAKPGTGSGAAST